MTDIHTHEPTLEEKVKKQLAAAERKAQHYAQSAGNFLQEKGALSETTNKIAATISKSETIKIDENQARGIIPFVAGALSAGIGLLLIKPAQKVSEFAFTGLSKVVTGFGLFEKIPLIGGAFTAVGNFVKGAGEYVGAAFPIAAALIGFKMFQTDKIVPPETAMNKIIEAYPAPAGAAAIVAGAVGNPKALPTTPLETHTSTTKTYKAGALVEETTATKTSGGKAPTVGEKVNNALPIKTGQVVGGVLMGAAGVNGLQRMEKSAAAHDDTGVKIAEVQAGAGFGGAAILAANVAGKAKPLTRIVPGLGTVVILADSAYRIHEEDPQFKMARAAEAGTTAGVAIGLGYLGTMAAAAGTGVAATVLAPAALVAIGVGAVAYTGNETVEMIKSQAGAAESLERLRNPDFEVKNVKNILAITQEIRPELQKAGLLSFDDKGKPVLDISTIGKMDKVRELLQEKHDSYQAEQDKNSRWYNYVDPRNYYKITDAESNAITANANKEAIGGYLKRYDEFLVNARKTMAENTEKMEHNTTSSGGFTPSATPPTAKIEATEKTR